MAAADLRSEQRCSAASCTVFRRPGTTRFRAAGSTVESGLGWCRSEKVIRTQPPFRVAWPVDRRLSTAGFAVLDRCGPLAAVHQTRAAESVVAEDCSSRLPIELDFAALDQPAPD